MRKLYAPLFILTALFVGCETQKTESQDEVTAESSKYDQLLSKY